MQHQLFWTRLLSEVSQTTWFLSQMHVFASGSKTGACANWHRGWPSVHKGSVGRPRAHALERRCPGLGKLPLLLTGLEVVEELGWSWICFNGGWGPLEMWFLLWEVKPSLGWEAMGRVKHPPARTVCNCWLKSRPLHLQETLVVQKILGPVQRASRALVWDEVLGLMLSVQQGYGSGSSARAALLSPPESVLKKHLYRIRW